MTELLASHLAFAAGAGVATFLSPCAVPLVPGYVGYYLSAAGEEASVVGVVSRGVAAAAGVLVALGALSGLAIAVGRPVVGLLGAVEPLVGAALIALGVLSATDRGPEPRLALPGRRAGTGGFALFGAGYAGAAAGCVLPVFLALIVQAVTLPPAAAGLTVAAYAGGVAAPLLAVTVALGLGVDVAAGRLAGHGARLRLIAGVVMVLAGAGQVLLALAPGVVELPSVGVVVLPSLFPAAS